MPLKRAKETQEMKKLMLMVITFSIIAMLSTAIMAEDRKPATSRLLALQNLLRMTQKPTDPTQTYVGIKNPTTFSPLAQRTELYYVIKSGEFCTKTDLDAGTAEADGLMGGNARSCRYEPTKVAREELIPNGSYFLRFTVNRKSGVTQTQSWNSGSESYNSSNRRGSYSSSSSSHGSQSGSALLTGSNVVISAFKKKAVGETPVASNIGSTGDQATLSSGYSEQNRHHDSSANRHGTGSYERSSGSGQSSQTDQGYVENQSAWRANPAAVRQAGPTTLRELISDINAEIAEANEALAPVPSAPTFVVAPDHDSNSTNTILLAFPSASNTDSR